MLDHKSFNVGLAALAFILSLTTAAWATKDAQDVRKAGLSNIGAGKDLTNLYNTSIAMTIFSAILLLMTIGVYHLNDQNFAAAKVFVCVIVFILSIIMLVFGSKLTELRLAKRYDATAITTGVVGMLLTGSCVFTVLKMLHLVK